LQKNFIISDFLLIFYSAFPFPIPLSPVSNRHHLSSEIEHILASTIHPTFQFHSLTEEESLIQNSPMPVS
jgi:hypothetical protein